MKNVMIAAIILHNMIVEDERNNPATEFAFDDGFAPFQIVPGSRVPSYMLQQRATMRQIRSQGHHTQLQLDLVQHLWDLKRDGSESGEDD